MRYLIIFLILSLSSFILYGQQSTMTTSYGKAGSTTISTHHPYRGNTTTMRNTYPSGGSTTLTLGRQPHYNSYPRNQRTTYPTTQVHTYNTGTYIPKQPRSESTYSITYEGLEVWGYKRTGEDEGQLTVVDAWESIHTATYAYHRHNQTFEYVEEDLGGNIVKQYAHPVKQAYEREHYYELVVTYPADNSTYHIRMWKDGLVVEMRFDEISYFILHALTN